MNKYTCPDPTPKGCPHEGACPGQPVSEMPEGVLIVLGAVVGLMNVLEEHMDDLPPDVRFGANAFKEILAEHVVVDE